MGRSRRGDTRSPVAPGATVCYASHMRRISQRELRNQNAAVMDEVERGETFRITRRGVEVAELRPLPVDTFVATIELRRRLARFPAGDLAQMRREADQFFGDDDRVG